MQTFRIRLSIRLALIVLLSLITPATPRAAYAANQVVSDCGDSGGANQLRAKINAAQSSGGGTITFSCGPIVYLGSLLPIITANITINGGNTVTLSGNNADRMLYVGGTGTLTLNNLTLTKGLAAGDGGAVRNDGTLNVNNSKFIDNHTTAGWSGGAIATYGHLNVTNSEFANNSAANGGALYAKHLDGIADIRGSRFHDNQTQDLNAGWGGAILVFDGADVTLDHSELKNNQAGYGGAVYVYSSQETDLELDNSTVSGNTGKHGGGAIYANTTNVEEMARIDIFTTTISSNVTGAADSVGGGIANFDGQLIVINSLLYGNQAKNNPNNNGETYGGGIYNTGYVGLRNVTLSQNYARSSGGGLYNSGRADATNVTIYRSCCGFGGGAGFANGGIAILKNTIITLGGSNTNCGGANANGGFNFSDDATCGFGAGHDVVDTMLGPLTFNGGPTAVHLPSSSPQSPAIDTAQCTDMYGFDMIDDQRGYPRPHGAGCDAGAAEVGLLPQLWLPLLVK